MRGPPPGAGGRLYQRRPPAVAPDGSDDLELGKIGADRIDDGSLLPDEEMAGSMKHQAALLLDVLVGTNRMLGLVTASQIPSASVASFFCRLT